MRRHSRLPLSFQEVICNHLRSCFAFFFSKRRSCGPILCSCWLVRSHHLLWISCSLFSDVGEALSGCLACVRRGCYSPHSLRRWRFAPPSVGKRRCGSERNPSERCCRRLYTTFPRPFPLPLRLTEDEEARSPQRASIAMDRNVVTTQSNRSSSLYDPFLHTTILS